MSGYEGGFIDRCLERGVTDTEVVRALYKKAALTDYLRKPGISAAVGAGAGGLLGGGAGYFMTEDEDDKWGNALASGVVGAGAGGLAGYGGSKYLGGKARQGMTEDYISSLIENTGSGEGATPAQLQSVTDDIHRALTPEYQSRLKTFYENPDSDLSQLRGAFGQAGSSDIQSKIKALLGMSGSERIFSTDPVAAIPGAANTFNTGTAFQSAVNFGGREEEIAAQAAAAKMKAEAERKAKVDALLQGGRPRMLTQEDYPDDMPSYLRPSPVMSSSDVDEQVARENWAEEQQAVKDFLASGDKDFTSSSTAQETELLKRLGEKVTGLQSEYGRLKGPGPGFMDFANADRKTEIGAALRQALARQSKFREQFQGSR